jgi:hypothetical protein
VANFLGHEEMTGNFPHGIQHPNISDVPGSKLLLDHLFTLTNDLVLCTEMVFEGP